MSSCSCTRSADYEVEKFATLEALKEGICNAPYGSARMEGSLDTMVRDKMAVATDVVGRSIVPTIVEDNLRSELECAATLSPPETYVKPSHALNELKDHVTSGAPYKDLTNSPYSKGGKLMAPLGIEAPISASYTKQITPPSYLTLNAYPAADIYASSSILNFNDNPLRPIYAADCADESYC